MIPNILEQPSRDVHGDARGAFGELISQPHNAGPTGWQWKIHVTKIG